MSDLTIFLLTVALFIFLSTPRFLRWLAMVQQKEYRFDRIWLFLKTAEGRAEILRLLPKLKDLTCAGLKRPVRTTRVYLIFFLSQAFVFLILLFLRQTVGFGGLLIGLVGFYALWPFIILLAVIPTVVVSEVVTGIFLLVASEKIKASKPIVIGITGSYGKSTTKFLTQAVLSQKEPVFATPFSHNTRFSIAQSILKNYHREKIVILELGAYKKGEIKTICRYFPPAMAVITGFSLQHFGLFGSGENIIKAKSELVMALTTGFSLFCNDSDSGALTIAKSRSDLKLIEANKTVSFSNVSLDARGQLSFAWDNFFIQTKLVGQHYLSNLKLAIAIGKAFQIPKEKIVEALIRFETNPMMISVKNNSLGALIVDDGKTSNPTGFKAALDLLQELATKNNVSEVFLITAGIVDLGEKEIEIHQELAKAAKKAIGRVYYLGVSGLTEFLREFGEDCLTDQAEIKKLLGLASAKQLYLIEGRVPKWVYEILNF